MATRNNDLGEFDCNYYINNSRFCQGWFSVPFSLFGIFFSLKIFSSISGKESTEFRCVLKSHSV